MKLYPVLAAAFAVLGILQTFAAPNPPKDLPTSDWNSILAAHDAAQRAIVADEDGMHSALTPSQGWRVRFDGRGFMVHPRSGDWEWGLALQSYEFGPDHVVAPEGKAKVSSEANRLTYHWDATVQEWFVNQPYGLLQGWTIARPPGGDPSQFSLHIAVAGGLLPQVPPGATSIAFQAADGTTALTYSSLHAWDADGKTLPVSFAAIPGESSAFAVRVDTAKARFPVTVDPIAQQAYLKASNTDGEDYFGSSVAVSGDTVVVGAIYEDSNATGVNGDQANNLASQAGAAYVFVRNGSTWTQQAYLKASNTDADDQFGTSVAVSDNTIVVGAPNEFSNATGVNGNQTDNSLSFAGAAYVFVRNGTTWTQQAYLKASNTGEGDLFGLSVSVSGDTIVVGAPLEESNATGVNGNQVNNTLLSAGAAYVFVRNGTTWSQQAYLKASNTDELDYFGTSVTVSSNTVVVGAPYEGSNATGVNGNQTDNSLSAGAAYVFVRNGTTWTQQAYLKASNTGNFDEFGYSVAVSGDTVVVGARGERSNATGVNGDQADNSVQYAGAAYVFVRNGTTWSQQAYLKASDTSFNVGGYGDQFGTSVAVSGDTIIVGAPHEDSNATGVNGNPADNSLIDAGAAYVFVRDGSTWTQQAYLKASNTGSSDDFGKSVSVSGDTFVVGAFESSNATGVNGNQADNSAVFAGAAYVFDLASLPPALATNSSQEAYLKASNPDASDSFSSVAMSGNTLVVGAGLEDSSSSGINGDQLNNSATNAGAVYVFVRDGDGWSQQAYLKASNPGPEDGFGVVAISGDTLVVGAPGEDSNARGVNGDQSNNSGTNSGAAYVFVRSGTNWTQQAYLKPSNTEFGEKFGTGVAVDGDTIVVGAWIESSGSPGVNGDENDNSVPAAGAAYVFVRNGSNWTQQAYLKASNPGTNDFFGITVAISGDTIAIGAIFEDSGSPGINGNQADNSVTNAGAVYVFVRNGSNWTQQAYIKASNPGSDYIFPALFGDEFGGSLALTGNTLVVGARNESSNATGVNGDQNNNSGFGSGAAYVFSRTGTNWSQEAYLKPNTSPGFFGYFGESVALASSNLVIIGAVAEDSDTTGINGPATNTGANDSGAAYVFERSAGSWSQIAYVKASNTGAGDSFGAAVAGSGNLFAVSASYEASSASGVNGNQLDNSLSGSGAVYIFSISAPALVITSTGSTTALISWPSPSAGWSLEENTTLTGGIWITPAEPISDDGTNMTVSIETTNASRFFRLAQ